MQLTTLGNSGQTGPTSVSGYGTSGPCTQIAASTPAGVQRFTVPATGVYKLDVAGSHYFQFHPPNTFISRVDFSFVSTHFHS